MKRAIVFLLMVFMLLSVTACQKDPSAESTPPAQADGAQLGEWAATTQWSAEGENLKVNSPDGSYAYNTGMEMEDIFEVSATIAAGEGAQEAGIVFGDKNQKAIVEVRLLYADGNATLKASYSLNEMQKDILTSDALAADGAVTLKVSKEAGDRSLKITVASDSGEMYSEAADEVPSLVSRSIKWAGLYGKGSVEFSSIIIMTEDPVAQMTVGEINPQPHVENENYMFSYGAICNKDANGNDIIIIDNQEGEAAAWNTNDVLGGAWTIKARAQIGQCKESSGNARFALLGEDNNSMLALVTCRVDPINRSIMFENAQDGTNNWAMTAGASKWFSMTTAAFDIVITRHSGENCLYIQISDVNGEVLYAVQTADYPEGVLDSAKHFGFCVWQTQTQYSNIEVDTENSVDIEIVDRSFIEGITDSQYMNFDRRQTTDAWDLIPDVYYQSGSEKGDALLFNTDSDATAKLKQDLGDEFTLSMDLKYLLSYAETNHTRLFFWGENQSLPFIIDVRTIMGTYYFGAQYQYNGAWTDNLFPDAGGTLIEDDIRIVVTRKAGDNKLFIQLTDIDGTVLMEEYSPEIPNIDEIHYLEIHSGETITIVDNIVVE